MIRYTIIYHDGDTITSRINATPAEVCEKFPIGAWHNVGRGPHDCYKQIVSVAIEDGGG